jgi:hypothetical protein
MPNETSQKTGACCPSCGTNGKRVSRATVDALLKDEYRTAVAVAENPCAGSQSDSRSCRKPVDEESGWRFCGSPECEVVYYAQGTGARFTKSQLRVPVGIKEKAGGRPLCYCFGHSVATIEQELRTKGRSDALEDIRGKMKGPGCACEVKNPSGSCCLGTVRKAIEAAKSELRGSMPTGKQTLSGQCRDDDCPEAPPAPPTGEKAP